MLRQLTALLLLVCTYPVTAAVELPGVLVDTAWLAKHLEQVVVLDIRKKTATFTNQGHIPNARLVDAKAIRSSREVDGHKMVKLVLTPSEFKTLMSQLGVNNDDTLIVTYQGQDAVDLAWAARLYWTLHYYGLNKVAILNGGTPAWQAAGQKLATTAVSIKPNDAFTLPDQPKDILADTRAVKAALDNADVQIVDARGLGYYLGSSQKSYVYGAGHIPDAKLFSFDLLVSNNAPSTMLDIDTLKATLAALKIDPDKPTVVYCNSGHVASSVWFAMSEVLGNNKVQMYDGSLHAWTLNKDLPLAKMRME